MIESFSNPNYLIAFIIGVVAFHFIFKGIKFAFKIGFYILSVLAIFYFFGDTIMSILQSIL